MQPDGPATMSKYRRSTAPLENRQLSYSQRHKEPPITGYRSSSRNSVTWSWGTRNSYSEVQARQHGGSEILEPPTWLKRNMSSGRLETQTRELSEYLKEQRQKERRQRLHELKLKRKEARRLTRSRTPGVDDDVDSEPDDDLAPFERFRRAARVVRLMIHTCKVCKESLVYSLMDESWYQMVGDLVNEAERNVRPHGKSFVTFVANENHELEQLEFDVGEFKKDYNKSEDLLTDEVKEILQLRPTARNKQQVNDAVKCLKKINQEFRALPLEQQRKIAECSFYDKFLQQRVILRGGLPPDGIYFVLSGSVVEKGTNIKDPQEFRAGDKFGEEDLTCGCSRRSTIVTQTTTELLYLHKEDYMEIFNMAVDSTDPKNLDICKKDIVFSHYPMQKLIDNPSTWSVLRYKFGRLIVKDSNNMEFIYVIKSGEARVIKHLHAGTVDVKARRKKIQAMMDAEDAYHQTRKLLDFVSERSHVQSHYRPNYYHPRVGLKSAPARLTNREAKYSYNRSRMLSQQAVADVNNNNDGEKEADDNDRAKLVNGRTLFPRMTRANSFAEFGENDPEKLSKSDVKWEVRTKDDTDVDAKSERSIKIERGCLSHIQEAEEVRVLSSRSNKSTRSEKLPSLSTNDKAGVLLQLNAKPKKKSSNVGSFHKKDPGQPRNRVVFRRRISSEKSFEEDCIYYGKDSSGSQIPPFVQLESLHAGRVFGLRSCLPVEERGPMASLVSAGCEILQINKNFFCRHLDENLTNLIKFKSKVYPSQEELVDRLDINLQWQEFKKEAMKSVLEECQIDVHKRWAEHSTVNKIDKLT